MRTTRDRGFTVLEALIAVAILGLAAGSLVMANQRAATRSIAALERFRTVLAAENALARLGLDLPVRAGRQAGETADGLRWTLDLARRNAQPGARGLFDVTAEARGRDGTVVRLTSVVIGR